MAVRVPDEPERTEPGLFESGTRLPDEPADHREGHRVRLRERFAASQPDGFPDYELLELILFRSIPRRDVKPIAKQLIKRFGTFGEVLAAPPSLLREVEGVGESVVTDLKLVEAAARRITKGPSPSARCSRPGAPCSIIAAPPWPSPPGSSSGSSSSTSAAQ